MRKNLDQQWAGLSEQTGSPRGQSYWRSLEELSASDEFQQMMRMEFPEQADVWPDALSRRRFLTLMGASLALAGLGGCSIKPAPAKKIVPYVRSPRDITPGKPLFFATTMMFAGEAVGLLVESHMGRPTKIEGNPDHPASLGATSPFHQASVLTLYDPDRSQLATHLGQNRTWDDAFSAIRSMILGLCAKNGAGLRILSEPILSPTLAEQRRQLLAALPEAKWHVYQPIHRESQLTAARNAFGQPVDLRYDFRKADVVLSLDADFLASGAGHLRSIRDFMSRRTVLTKDDIESENMNRLYVAESTLTATGAKADHRMAIRPSRIEALARALAARLGLLDRDDAAASDIPNQWLDAIAADLTQHRGRSLVIAGDAQLPSVHLLAHAINDRLGNFGETVVCIDPILDQPESGIESLRELIVDLQRQKVEALFILGGNPVYTAPVDLPFAESLQQAPFRVHLGLYQDETARQCHWHLPEAYYLEAWSDARAFDGTASIVQPLIEPLYHGRSIHEVVSFLTDLRETPGEITIRDYWHRHWSEHRPTERFSEFWQTALHDGFVAHTAFPSKDVSLQADWRQHLENESSSERSAELELVFRPSPAVHDGTFANNGWLQELPDPLTKLTWGNAALMSPATARKLGMDFGRYAHGGEHGGYHMPGIRLELGDRTLETAAWIVPGQPDDVIGITLGHGRTSAGRVGGTADHQVGFNAYRLRSSTHPWFETGVNVVPLASTHLVACTQQHHLMENRDIVRAGTVDRFRMGAEFTGEVSEASEALTYYQPYNYDPPLQKWGMAINLGACVGCNACVVACQAENNIPVVGKEQVAAGREMHWLRIDRYLQGTMDDPQEIHFQPVPCMHCEHAPCEYVCPVNATVHSAEGLNEMVYNRCVGTRFCSNNCPYKVRRFNFLAFSDFESQVRGLQYNPDVTVRSRGVMEKCSYCVQRIRHAEIDAQQAGRPIKDGDVVTACQAACPARAIAFGDLNDSSSEVAQQKNSPLNYGLLADLNTVPRTTYLAALRNPNPQWEES